MPKLLKLTFKSDHKIGKTLYTAGQSLTVPDVYLFGSVEQRRDAPLDFFAKSSGLVEEIALLYFQIIADITIEFDGGLMQQSEKFYANPFTDLTVTTVAFILNPSLDITVRISGIRAGEKPTGSQPLSLDPDGTLSGDAECEHDTILHEPDVGYRNAVDRSCP